MRNASAMSGRVRKPGTPAARADFYTRDQGSRLILYGLSKTVREVMELSRLQKIFEIYDNEEQALSSQDHK